MKQEVVSKSCFLFCFKASQPTYNDYRVTYITSVATSLTCWLLCFHYHVMKLSYFTGCPCVHFNIQLIFNLTVVYEVSLPHISVCLCIVRANQQLFQWPVWSLQLSAWGMRCCCCLNTSSKNSRRRTAPRTRVSQEAPRVAARTATPAGQTHLSTPPTCYRKTVMPS